MTPRTSQFLVRVLGRDINFVPIKSEPQIKNYILVTTCEEYKFDEEVGKFVQAGASGILYMKKGEHSQRLAGFKAKDLEHLMDKIGKRVAKHYLNTG